MTPLPGGQWGAENEMGAGSRLGGDFGPGLSSWPLPLSQGTCEGQTTACLCVWLSCPYHGPRAAAPGTDRLAVGSQGWDGKILRLWESPRKLLRLDSWDQGWSRPPRGRLAALKSGKLGVHGAQGFSDSFGFLSIS